MLIDILLNMVGKDPTEFTQSADKWASFWVQLIIFAVPLYLLFLVAAPFLFLWWKKKRFSLKNIILALLVSIALVAFGLFSLVAAFYILQSFAFVELYSS